MTENTMSVAMRKVWAEAYERALKNITSLRNHCDFKFGKYKESAKEIEVLNAFRPTIKKYVPGEGIEKEYVDATATTIKLDQFFYFNIAMDDIHKYQSVKGAMEAAANEGSIALSEQGDMYVASLVKKGVEDNSIDSVATITPSKTNAIEHIENGFAVLYSKNCKVSENYWLEVDPSYYKVIRPSMTELLTNNVEMAKKGIVGKYGNAHITIENLLAKDETGKVVYNQLRTERAIAFVEQINKVKPYEPENGFESALKGLYVFGAKVVRPDEIVVLKTNIA